MEPTERVPLGRTRLWVTRVGIGTGPIGNLYEPVAEEDALGALDRAWALGIRHFDTAPMYGFGIAERRLGEVLRSKPRDEFVVSTKVGRLLRADAPPDPKMSLDPGVPLFAATPPVNPVEDFSRDATLRSLEESLERLGLGRVDIVHIHGPEDHYAEVLDGAFPSLAALRSEGVIGAIGVGMDDSAMLARFARDADFDCFLLAAGYTVLEQPAAAELLPLCVDRGIALILGGLLRGGIVADREPGERFRYGAGARRALPRIRELREVCARHGVSAVAAALQFPAAHPAVASVLVGVRTPGEVEEDLALAKAPVPAALWEELRRSGFISPDVPADAMPSNAMPS